MGGRSRAVLALATGLALMGVGHGCGPGPEARRMVEQLELRTGKLPGDVDDLVGAVCDVDRLIEPKKDAVETAGASGGHYGGLAAHLDFVREAGQEAEAVTALMVLIEMIGQPENPRNVAICEGALFCLGHLGDEGRRAILLLRGLANHTDEGIAFSAQLALDNLGVSQEPP